MSKKKTDGDQINALKRIGLDIQELDTKMNSLYSILSTGKIVPEIHNKNTQFLLNVLRAYEHDNLVANTKIQGMNAQVNVLFDIITEKTGMKDPEIEALLKVKGEALMKSLQTPASEDSDLEEAKKKRLEALEKDAPKE